MTRPFYIIGFMGTGKSSLKRYLENDYEVKDLDEALEQELGMTISTYFKKMGEGSFRQHESRLLRKIQGDFIVTGGGVVESADNMRWMRQHGRVVALDLPFEECWERIKDSNRPLVLNGKEYVELLYNRRQALYKGADFLVDASLSTEAIAHELQRLKEEV